MASAGAAQAAGACRWGAAGVSAACCTSSRAHEQRAEAAGGLGGEQSPTWRWSRMWQPRERRRTSVPHLQPMLRDWQSSRAAGAPGESPNHADASLCRGQQPPPELQMKPADCCCRAPGGRRVPTKEACALAPARGGSAAGGTSPARLRSLQALVQILLSIWCSACQLHLTSFALRQQHS